MKSVEIHHPLRKSTEVDQDAVKAKKRVLSFFVYVICPQPVPERRGGGGYLMIPLIVSSSALAD